MAGILSGHLPVEITLQDVTPMTVGLAVDHEVEMHWLLQIFKRKQYEKLMVPMIKKNSYIPVSITKEFATVQDNQTTFAVSILEGEQPMAQDNYVLD